MKIAMISKADSSGGGASKVATQLTQLLRNEKIDVDHFTRSASTSTDTIPLYTDFEKKIYHRLLDLGIQEYFPFERKVLKKYDALKHYDIFHFHDITSTVSPLTLKYLSDHGKKIVWTIHDCSIVTGGCLYPLECKQYLTSCKHCPQLGSFGLGRNFDFTQYFHKIKKYVLQNSNIHFVAPSKWIADLVYNTGYIQNYPTIISNGVDTNLYKLINKKAIRDTLNLPKDRFILLLSSSNIQNPYKGISYAIETIGLLKKINPFVLLIGKKGDAFEHHLKGIDFFATGYISDQQLLNQYYSAADIFLNTTIEDNQPLTVLEAMASGTPNVGFRTGGIPEIVQVEKTGLLVEKKDVTSLAKSIEKHSQQNSLESIGKESQKWVKKFYSQEIFFKKHLNLYKKVNIS
jgi:glycosyltransferase involved in cell wall biosynthesis